MIYYICNFQMVLKIALLKIVQFIGDVVPNGYKLDNNSIYSLLLHRAILHSLRVRRKENFPFVLSFIFKYKIQSKTSQKLK